MDYHVGFDSLLSTSFPVRTFKSRLKSTLENVGAATSKTDHFKTFSCFVVFLQISVNLWLTLRFIHWHVNYVWLVNRFSGVYQIMQQIICCGVAKKWGIPIPYLYLIKTPKPYLTVISIWQDWVIVFRLRSNLIDKNFDLLTSLTNTSLK